MTTAAVMTDTATRVQPSVRRWIGAGGRRATTVATSSPGADAASNETVRTRAAVRMASVAVLAIARVRTARRVAAAARESPPPRTRRMTTRTAIVLATNSNANG